MRKLINPKAYILIIFLLTEIVITAQNIDKNIEDDLLHIEEKLYFYPAQGEDLLVGLKYRHRENELVDYQGQIDFLYGLLAYKKAETDSAIHFLEKALITFAKEKNSLYQAKSQLIIGWLSEFIGYWEQAKINYYKVIELAGDSNVREKGMAYLGIARCKMYNKEKPDNELNYGVEKINALNKQEYTLYAEYLSCLADKQHQQTPLRLNKVAHKYIQLGLNQNASSVYKSISSYYRGINKLDSALIYVNKALPLSNSDYPATSTIPALYQHMGLIYFKKGNYKLAKHYLQKSLSLSDKYKVQSTQIYIYECLYKLDTIQNDYKSGFYHISMARKNEENNFNTSKQHLSKIMEISTNLKLIKDEAIQLKVQKNNLIYISTLLIITILFISIIFWITIYNKNKQKLLQEKTEKLELHNIISKLGEVQLLKKYHKLSDEEKSGVDNLYDQFEIAYADYIINFRAQFNQLTDNDVRYAVMFAMDISDNVIAKIRNINPTSILKTKRRIREKLKLEKGTNLNRYFSESLKS